MKKAIALSCGSILALATGAYFFYRTKGKINFHKVKVLDKRSLLYLFREIRKEYSEKFSMNLRLNRKKRRCVQRGSREYRMFIKQLKDEAKEYIQKSIEVVLSNHGLNEEILAESYKHYENDIEIRSAISKLCTVETHKYSSLINRKLEEILKFYITRVEEFQEDDPNELNILMKILEDDMYDEFGCEPEELEVAVSKNSTGIESLIRVIKDSNENFLEKTNQELFF